MKRLRLGVDVDGVLADWDDHARDILFWQYKLVIPTSTSWDYVEKFIGKEKWDWLWAHAHERGLFLNPDPYIHNVQCLLKAAKQHDIIIITKVPEDCQEDRIAWLNTYKIPYTEAHLLVREGVSKAEVDCDAYLDDYEQNVEEIAERWPTKVVCLLNRPWNASYKTKRPNVFRVDTLQEFIDFTEACFDGLEIVCDAKVC